MQKVIDALVAGTRGHFEPMLSFLADFFPDIPREGWEHDPDDLTMDSTAQDVYCHKYWELQFSQVINSGEIRMRGITCHNMDCWHEFALITSEAKNKVEIFLKAYL